MLKLNTYLITSGITTSKTLFSAAGVKDKKGFIITEDKIKNKPNWMCFLMVLRLSLERFLMYRKKEGVGVFSI